MLSLEIRIVLSVVLWTFLMLIGLVNCIKSFSNEMFALFAIGLVAGAYRGWQLLTLYKLQKEYTDD